MGDRPGHPFRGNQYTKGQRVKFSGAAISRLEQGLGRSTRMDKIIRADVEKAKAARGTVVDVKEGKYGRTVTVDFEGEGRHGGRHHAAEYMISPAEQPSGATVLRSDWKKSKPRRASKPRSKKQAKEREEAFWKGYRAGPHYD